MPRHKSSAIPTLRSSVYIPGGDSVPVPASASFVVLESGELLSIDSTAAEKNQRSQRNFGQGATASIDGQRYENFENFPEDDEYGETDCPTEGEDFDEEESNESFQDEANEDGPSTSGIQSVSGKELPPLSESIKAALMSSETTDLLNDLRSAYFKMGRGEKIRRLRRRGHEDLPSEESDSDSIEDEVEGNQQEEMDDDDPMDEDYYPSKKQKQRTEAKRRQQAKKIFLEKKKADAAKNVNSARKAVLEKLDRPQKSKTQGGKSALAQLLRAPSSFWSDDDLDDGHPSGRFRRTQKLPLEVESLLGQSIVSFAQGRREEALKMVEEVVISHPGYYESYDRLAMFYGEMGDKEKQLHFGLLAAHLNSNCDGDKWADLAALAAQLGDRQQAVRCFTKAFRANPTVQDYYSAKINILEQDLAIATDRDTRKSLTKQIGDTKLASVKGLIMNKGITTDQYTHFAQKMFEDFYGNGDIRRSMLCLKCVLERAKIDSGTVLYDDLNNLVSVAIHGKDYEDAIWAVFRYTKLQAFNGGTLVKFGEEKFQDSVDHRRQLRAFIGDGGEKSVITHYIVPEGFPVEVMGKTITCWIRLKRYDCCKPLLDMLRTEVLIPSAAAVYWEIAESLFEASFVQKAEEILEQLVVTTECEKSPAVWLCYAETLSFQGRLEAASMAFSRVVQLSPHNVSARLSLSALQQQLGQAEEALHTLDMGDGRVIEPENMDERLLAQRCLLLRNHGGWTQFIKAGRCLMAMYFKDVSWSTASSAATGIKHGGYRTSPQLRTEVLSALRGTNWQLLIDRVPRSGTSTVPHDDLWDIFSQLCELLYERRMFTDYFYITCLASQSSPFLRGFRLRIVTHLLLHSSVLKRNSKIAWTVIRYCMPTNNSNGLWNIYGLLFVFNQEVRYHKFTLRAMMKMPDNVALAWFSGNNSLITGTYQHALAEYFYILQRKPNDPLLNLLIGLCFTHLAAKKFIAVRHDLCIQGLAFLSKYEELRGPCQEVYYNMGRAFQQVGVFYAAIHFYKKALNMEPATVVDHVDGDERHKGVGKTIYDLRPIIAHNLALIYRHSNNLVLARDLLERYCTIE